MKAYELQKFDLQNLVMVEREKPQVEGHQVLVRFHAASLNYRDLMFAKGIYNPHAKLPVVPFSDGAGEVVAVGEKATRWKTGDRVCAIFMQGWLEGAPAWEKHRTSLGGGELDGVLREYGAFDESGLVRIPDHLTFNEAATLPCAAVTAWNALVDIGRLKAGDTVLTLGTGGVSIFALQFAKMQGARVIVTSSSDEKLARARSMGADETINYKKTPDWEKEVLRLTGRAGVDLVIELGGPGTVAKSVSAVRVGGCVALIGVLVQGEGFNPISLLMKAVRMQGVFVGSRQMFEDMNRAIAANKLKPVIDRTFSFDQARNALQYMESAGHVGKIIVEI